VSKDTTIEQLSAFIKAAVTPYHCVEKMSAMLNDAGFTYLNEKDSWQLSKGAKYYTTRNGSSIVAWCMPSQGSVEDSGFRMIGAHTDSPCLKVKPNPEITANGYLQLGVQVYGGVLLNPWFDRDLSLAGRVSYRDTQGKINSSLINFEKAIAVIPNLAIHLNREANSGFKINPQTMVTPIIGQVDQTSQAFNFRGILTQHLLDKGIAC